MVSVHPVNNEDLTFVLLACSCTTQWDLEEYIVFKTRAILWLGNSATEVSVIRYVTQNGGASWYSQYCFHIFILYSKYPTINGIMFLYCSLFLLL